MLFYSHRNQIERHSFAVMVSIYRTGQSAENLKKKGDKIKTSTKYYCWLQNKWWLSYLELGCVWHSINNSLPWSSDYHTTKWYWNVQIMREK